MPDPQRSSESEFTLFRFKGYGGGRGGGGSSRAVIGMRSGEDKDLEGSTSHSSKARGPNPSDIRSPSDISESDDDADISESDDDGEHRDNLPQMPFVDLSVYSSARIQALDGMERGEEFICGKRKKKKMRKEKLPKWQPGKSERILLLKRAWLVRSAWASIENVCKISSSVLVNKLQCEHIADHFKVTADVLQKLGLGKDFVPDKVLEGGSGSQINFDFDETRFNHIAETFEDYFFWSCRPYSYNRDFLLGTQIQDVSSMFQDYIRELPAMDGSSEESLSKKSKISESFQDFSILGTSTRENVEARSHDRKQCRLDEFLCLLLGVLKQGEDLVLFHFGLEGANNEVVERTGICGEKFVQIHSLIYQLLDFYACLELCEGTEFARGYLSQHDPCSAQSLLHYLNSNVLEESTSVYIDDNFLNIELATTLSELLERPNCILKTLSITAFSVTEIDQVELRKLQKCHLMVIAALSKCVSITSLTVRDLNGEEVHELCKSLLINKVLENLVVSIDGPLADNNAMDLSTMLKENHSLKSFTLKSDNISDKGAAYIGAMLAKNSSLEELNLDCSTLDKTGMKDLMRPLMADRDGKPQVNLSLKHLCIHIWDEQLPEVAEVIAQLLRTNKTLTHFSIDFQGSDPDAICEILDSLKKNRTLQVLDFQGWSSFGNHYQVASCLEAMLTENSTLEELKVDMLMWDEVCLKHLLKPLMANEDGEPHVKSSLKRLHILDYDHNEGSEVVESIVEMLRTNETLSHFSMINASLNTSDVCKILDSLKTNKALQMLDLDECQGLDNPQVKVAFMDLLVNYNFTLCTIRMHGMDSNIEDFMKSKLKLGSMMAEGRLWSLADGISESTPVCSASLKQALEDLKLEKGEGSRGEVHDSSLTPCEEHQEELVGGFPSKPEVVCRFKSKLEMESDQSLQDLKPILESVMKSKNFLLRRNLNMAQLLQERYTQCNLFSGMYPSDLTDEEKDDLSKECIIASLFPKTFLYHLKVRLLQGANPRGILHMLKEVASLIVERVKSLQDSGSQTFQFIDYVDFQAPLDVQHMYSLRDPIAICQTFSTNTGMGEEMQAENSIQYGIVQDHLTRAYYFDSDKASNLDKPNLDKSTGVIGVKVTSTKIHVEIVWEDGSYYFGVLEDFSYDLKPDDNKQCTLEAFGDLKGAHFLKTHGLKCSPLLVIALAMAIHKRGLALMWSNGKGHIEINSILLSLQPMELEVWECQILFGGDINQLGETVEWGMNQFDHNYASSSRVHRDNQCQGLLEYDMDQNMHISNISNDTSMDIRISDKFNNASSHTLRCVDLSAVVAQFNAGAQNKQKWSIAVKVLGSGGDIGFEKQNSKGKKVEDQAFEKIQELYWEEKGGYIIGKLDDRHELLEEKLYQGSLYAERDLNYLVVYDGRTASHVSLYWVKERVDEPKLELEWIIDIFIKEGPEEIKSIFKGLKGETLEVTRTGTQFLENPSQRQSKGFMKRFINHYSNKGSCQGNALQMVSKFEDHVHPILEGRSNDEWEHIVGLQPNICSNKCWWKASYMQAITYSRTRYSSGLLLSTHTSEEYGLKWGSCTRKSRLDGLDYVHKSSAIKSCGKFSKPPQSLSSKWHDMIHWGGLKETLV